MVITNWSRAGRGTVGSSWLLVDVGFRLLLWLLSFLLIGLSRINFSLLDEVQQLIDHGSETRLSLEVHLVPASQALLLSHVPFPIGLISSLLVLNDALLLDFIEVDSQTSSLSLDDVTRQG